MSTDQPTGLARGDHRADGEAAKEQAGSGRIGAAAEGEIDRQIGEVAVVQEEAERAGAEGHQQPGPPADLAEPAQVGARALVLARPEVRQPEEAEDADRDG